MAECSKCGKQAMTFTCRYCDEKFCSEHRLPENHDCEKLEEASRRSGETSETSGNDSKWFKDQDLKKETIRGKPKKTPRKPSLFNDIVDTVRSSYTLLIIGITVLSFLLQGFIPGYQDFLTLSPALNEATVTAINNAASQIYGQPLEILAKTFFEAPWGIITVALVHGSLFHLFANMVTFYFFGKTMEKTVGNGEMLKLYIGSAVGASIAYILFRNLIYQIHGPLLPGILGAGANVAMGPAVGASGAVVAIFAAVAMLYPRAEVLLYFFIPMKIKTALYLFAAVEGVNLATKMAGVVLPVIGGFASSAHLAGLAIGFWYGRKIRDRYRSGVGTLDLFGY